MVQGELFNVGDPPPAGPEPPRFGGATYDPDQDEARLTGQLAGVFGLMRDGEWRTHAEIAAVVGGSVTGISARLRDLRKEEFGKHTVERRRRGDGRRGLFEYRLVPREEMA